MKSRANIKSHPLHPILIVFPIAFLSATGAIDLMEWFTTADFSFGKYLHIAGLLSGAAAAIPGIIDYFYTVPPASSAKKRAAKHGLLNTAALLLFVGSLCLKLQGWNEWVLALELPGLIMMFGAGWLGGTLVHRNLIGVDMRYAEAGKWKEFYIAETQGMVKLCEPNELKTDQMKLCHIGVKRIVLAKTETDFVAFDDRCSHRGGSLASGMMICGTVQCPWHGSQFDTCTGKIKAGPATKNIRTYPIEVREDGIYIDAAKTN